MEFCSKLSTTKVILCRESAVFLRGTSQPFMVLYLLAHPTPMLMFAVLFHFMKMTPHANYALMSPLLTCTPIMRTIKSICLSSALAITSPVSGVC